MPLSADKEEKFPRLAAEGYLVTSPATYDYNCIAFAADDEESWWWPDDTGMGFWPVGVTREETIEAFIEAYRLSGYEQCDHGLLEIDFEKIASYAEKGIPTHASKQLPDGRWKSKLGAWEDIHHQTVSGVCDSLYGQVAVFMRRAAYSL